MPVLKYHVNGFIEQLLFCIVSFTQHVALGIPPHFFKVSGKCFPLHCFVFHCVNVPPLLTILLLQIFGCLQFLVMTNKLCTPFSRVQTQEWKQSVLSPSIMYVEIHQKFSVFQSAYTMIHSYQQYMTLSNCFTYLLVFGMSVFLT